MIDNQAAYDGKIRSCTMTPCRPELCPKCGEEVGMAEKVDGKRYLAHLLRSRDGGTYAVKTMPHFRECTGVRKPGIILRGVRVVVARGRKVPVGTVGVVVWRGLGTYGERVGIKDDAGTTHWTALANVDEVTA